MTAKKTPRADDTPQADEPSGNTVIRVRRGALRRFDLLKQKSAGLPVEIEWDRRTDERRSPDEQGDTGRAPGPAERRRNERRQAAPFTWEMADFVVVGDTSERKEPPEDPPTPPKTGPKDV
jgi:hypothetical protein